MAKFKCAVCRSVVEQDEMPSICPKCYSNNSLSAIEAETTFKPVSAGKESWGDWSEMSLGHSQAVAAMSGLVSYTDEFKQNLIDTKEKWQEDKKISMEIYNSVVESATTQCEKEKANYREQCTANLATQDSRLGSLKNFNELCESFGQNVPDIDSAKVIVRSGLSRVADGYKATVASINKKRGAYTNLMNCQMAESERQRNSKLDIAKTEQLDRDKQADYRFETTSRTVCDIGRDGLASFFGKENLHKYSQNVMACRFNASSYECPTEIPDAVMIGTLGVSFPCSGQEEQAVIQAMDPQTNSFHEKYAGEYIVKIPYAQRLEDGISLLMRYSPQDKEKVQKGMQALLLKLFMSFPAGKLEATMVDPLELGASFPDIPRLATGPNSARIIDTKIWSKEKDIESAIATLRQKLENMTQAYGGDKESRLKKEAVRALAITDFPVGFNETALKDLQAIVRNAASLGVCVLICANDLELDKLKAKNSALVNEIVECVVETKCNGDRLMVVVDDSKRLFIQLDNMTDVYERKDTILSLIAEEIERNGVNKVKENFESLYQADIHDSNNWFTGDHTEIAIPIGIKGANTIIKMVMGRGGGSTEHHALVAGLTGSGKSTFFHTLIMSTMISYSPDEVQMYLLDFKEGVEFNIYTKYRLPSLRVVAINSEREFGLTVLKELCKELETRAKIFSKYGVAGINEYLELPGLPKMPKLIMVFDEVQELFREGADSDNISRECLSYLNKLVMQGRSSGIHLILACQDFKNCTGLEAYFSQMAIRIAIRGLVESASSILSSNNSGITALQNQAAGAAIYNGGGGVEAANNYFQIAYLDEETRLQLLEEMDEYYSDPTISEQHEDKQTRVLMTNARDDIHNCINQLIYNGDSSITHLAPSEDGYGLLLGQGFGKKSIFMPEMRRKDMDNLLVITSYEGKALSIFELASMSLLYEELHTNADKANSLLYIVDLSHEELEYDECDFEFLASQFDKQVQRADLGKAEEMINTLYDTMISRSEGLTPSTERLFLMFFGIDRAHKLKNSGMYDDNSNGEISVFDKLLKIFKNGPKYGINTILWGESHNSIKSMLGESYERFFAKRIAFGLESEEMQSLVYESNAKTLKGNTAVYIDIETDVKNTHFRPYDIPTKDWIEDYAEAYERTISGGGF